MTNLNSPPVEQNGFADNRFEGFGRGKLIIGGTLFLAITIGIFWYLFHYLEPGEGHPQFRQTAVGLSGFGHSVPSRRNPSFFFSHVVGLPCSATGAHLRDLFESRPCQLGDRGPHPFPNRGRPRPDLHLESGRIQSGNGFDHQPFDLCGHDDRPVWFGYLRSFSAGGGSDRAPIRRRGHHPDHDRRPNRTIGYLAGVLPIAHFRVFPLSLAGARPKIPFAELVEPQPNPIPAACRPNGALGHLVSEYSLHLPG